MTWTHKQVTHAAANMWSPHGFISEHSSAIGTIFTFLENSFVLAWFKTVTSSIDANGHLTSWTIEINRFNDLTVETMIHKFGHAFGLGHVTSSSHKNKIMYHVAEGQTATSPHSSDNKGLRVITGQHTSHTWAYNGSHFPSYIRMHRRFCTDCDGFKDEPCFPSSGTCHFCGKN